MKLNYIVLLSFALLLTSCSNKDGNYDASGVFETEETIIPAEVSGVINAFSIEEGEVLKMGQEVGYIDTVQLFLRKKQLEAQVDATLSQRPDIKAQLSALKSQLQTAEKEERRFNSLVKAEAATQKQLDDISAQVAVIRSQILALESSLTITIGSLNQQSIPLAVQIEQLNDQLKRSHIINPINGTVLTKYVEENEMAAPGKALYKVADLSTLILRAYITGDQITEVKIGQQLTVLVDSSSATRELPGVVSWISDKAEFTPKTIQTKDERANLVYAVKILVKNDGRLKPGMFAEVKF